MFCFVGFRPPPLSCAAQNSLPHLICSGIDLCKTVVQHTYCRCRNLSGRQKHALSEIAARGRGIFWCLSDLLVSFSGRNRATILPETGLRVITSIYCFIINSRMRNCDRKRQKRNSSRPSTWCEAQGQGFKFKRILWWIKELMQFLRSNGNVYE